MIFFLGYDVLLLSTLFPSINVELTTLSRNKPIDYQSTHKIFLVLFQKPAVSKIFKQTDIQTVESISRTGPERQCGYRLTFIIINIIVPSHDATVTECLLSVAAVCGLIPLADTLRH